MNLAYKEFAFSVHFISLRVDDLNLVDSNVIVDIEKKEQIPPNKKEVLMVL